MVYYNLVIAITHTLVYSISKENAFHSYCSFLLILTILIQPYLNHRLTELNVSLLFFFFNQSMFLINLFQLIKQYNIFEETVSLFLQNFECSK